MSRVLQYVAESSWTAEQALAWARTKKRWPARRFRVEGSHAGNSRLLPKKLAVATRSKYGGVLVELIPLPTIAGEPKKTLNQSRVDGMPACPRCGAAVGWPCRAKPRPIPGLVTARHPTPCPPHRERVKAQAVAEAQAVMDRAALAEKAAKPKKPRKPRAKKEVAGG